jgi:hypothetical protein
MTHADRGELLSSLSRAASGATSIKSARQSSARARLKSITRATRGGTGGCWAAEPRQVCLTIGARCLASVGRSGRRPRFLTVATKKSAHGKVATSGASPCR